MSGELILHFVRHGETTYNAERRVQGQMNTVPLSETGHKQAMETAENLASTKASAIIASDLLRAMQTAQTIGARLVLPITPEPALRERHFGSAQDKLYADFDEETRARWWSNVHDRFDGGGESWSDVYDRVGRFLDGLLAASEASELILVAHGGTVNVALAYVAGKPVDDMVWERLENCAVRTVRLRRP